MELEKFMGNIDFIFCDKNLVEECRELFIQALHEGIDIRTDNDQMNKIANSLADEVNLAPVPLLAKNIGNGVMVYYRAKYLLNFEYDTTYENWGFYIDFEDVNQEGLATIPLIFMLFYNVLTDTLDEYSSFPKLEPREEKE